jgi:hypothetical protein
MKNKNTIAENELLLLAEKLEPKYNNLDFVNQVIRNVWSDLDTGQQLVALGVIDPNQHASEFQDLKLTLIGLSKLQSDILRSMEPDLERFDHLMGNGGSV